MKLPLVALLAATTLFAQERLEVDGPTPATLRLGDAARVILRIEGRTANPREIVLPEVDGLSLAISPPSRSSQTFYDGRTLTERVGIQYALELRPQREGVFVVPPFTIFTGTREQQTPELRVEARKDLRGEELGYLDVVVERRRVYVHEPVRVRVEFGVQQGLRIVEDVYQMQHRYLDLEVQAPWLDKFPAGEPIEVPQPAGDRQLLILNRTLAYATADTVVRGAAEWRRFVVERAFLPTRLGKVELSAPMLRTHVVLREGQRDLFGGARGRQTDNLYSYGKPIELEVLPIPEQGRPDPYFGAVGRFTLEAAADRTDLKVGESVQLTLTVRGTGNLEFLAFPELADLPGFHRLGRKDDARTAERAAVTYDLTPLSADVTSIPAIAWNYFDTTPGVEKFVAVSTAPIPLRVSPLPAGESLQPLPESAPQPVQPGVDDIYDLPDLSGPSVAPQPVPAWLAWLAVALPMVIVVAALRGRSWLDSRRRDAAGARVRAAARNFERSVAAGREPSEALAEYLADRLDVPTAAVISPDLADRLRSAGMPDPEAKAAAQCLEQGAAAKYGGGRAPDAAAVRDLVRRCEGLRFVARIVPLLMALLFALDGVAQDKEPQLDPVAAYRAGEYAVAELGFAKQFADSGDYRFLRARGNCLVRLERLPEALWAYESARLATPRDPELLANLRLVRARLGLPPAEAGFAAELVGLRDALTPIERVAVAAALVAALTLMLAASRRHVGPRWLAALVAVPTAIAVAEVLWIGPSRPPAAIALVRSSITSEPRADLAPIATVLPGVAVTVLSGGEGAFVRVRAGDRIGYVPTDRLAVVR
ncbi:MAG: hypothetical protein RL398_1767 [Planctomycetota bacterium]